MVQCGALMDWGRELIQNPGANLLDSPVHAGGVGGRRGLSCTGGEEPEIDIQLTFSEHFIRAKPCPNHLAYMDSLNPSYSSVALVIW